MKPYFFPGIFISDELHEKLVNIFGSYIALEPLNHERRANVDYLDNITVNKDEIIKFISEYRYISEINPGIPKENLHFMKENIYFKNDLSKSSIRSEISGDKKEAKKNPALNSSIFLQLAYEYEMNDYQIDFQLKNASEKESEILEKLNDQNLIVNHTSIKNDERIEDKLQAYITLLNFSFKSNFFITTTQDILKYIIEDEEYETFIIEGTDSLSETIDSEYINKMCTEKYTGTEAGANNLTIHIIKKGPEKLFERFISSLPSSATNISDHTIIGIIG